MKEIYIIAQTIKTGGGKELLEYLLEYLDTNYPNVLVTVYVDKSFSIKSTYTRKVIVVVSTLKNVSLFFKRFENAIYFGNLPPIRKVNNSVLYFHNRYLLMSFTELFQLKNSKLINKLKNLLRQLLIKTFVNNIDFVVCQNKKVQEQFSGKYKYNNVEILPFFRSCPKTLKKIEKKFDFCYVSLAHPHKNHMNLLRAIEILSDKGISLNIALTVEKERSVVLEKIDIINKKGVMNIKNFGSVPKEDVCAIYSQSKSLIFPSTNESFGLPLVEAVELGLDIIASDLEYVYQVVEPSVVFNPNDIQSIAEAIQKYSEGQYPKSQSKIKNSISNLIELILKGQE